MRSVVVVAALWLLLASGFASRVQAGPSLLFDVADGKVLYAEDQDQLWHPASLTKIMTAYLAFEALKTGKLTLETKIACSELAHAQPPSKLGLPIGGEITVELALKLLIIKSANDVAVMLAEAIAGSEAAFAEKMNATAQRLGMTRTRFVNPHGLPAPEQVTTARDLARLSMAIVRDFPQHAELWTMPVVRIGKRNLRSHNILLKTYDGADGLKTGFICDSGYNVVASATRDGRRLVAVVLGETSGQERAVRAASLLEHGFLNYGWKEFLSPATLDSIAPSTRDVTPTSIRSTVVSWECGTGRRRRARGGVVSARQKARQQRMRAAKAAKGKKLGVAKAKAKPAEAGSASPVAGATKPKRPAQPAKAAKSTE